MSRIRQWTLEELTFLYEQRKLNVGYKEIGASLNRSANSCACKHKEFDWQAFVEGRINDDLTVITSGTEWTEEEIKYLYNQRLACVPYSVISRNMGRSYQSCLRKYNNTDWTALGMTNSVSSRIHKREVEAFKERTAVTVQNSLDRFRMRSDVIADSFRESARNLPAAPLVPWTPNKRVGSHSTEDMGLLLSDLHVGHEHSLDETGGISQYNINIFQQRMSNLKSAVADIYELHSQLYQIPTLRIFCLGDIVAGMNDAGAWSPVYIMTPITDQVTIGTRSLSDAIWYWLTIFEEVHFYGIRGNHGRIAQSGAEKDYANWDNIIYQFLEVEFRDNPRIKFNLTKTWWQIANIRNHNFLLLHGDDAKAKDPPIKSFLDVERKMAGYIKDQSHYTLAGHFHNASEITSTNGKVFMNGSFVGGDVYSIKNCLPGTRAEQKVFGIHDQRGVTFRYDIDLDYERDSRQPAMSKKPTKGGPKNDPSSPLGLALPT